MWASGDGEVNGHNLNCENLNTGITSDLVKFNIKKKLNSLIKMEN